MAAQHQGQQQEHMAAHAVPEAAVDGPSIQSVPGDVLFTHMAPHVLGDVAALRTSCRTFRTNAAVVVAEAAQAASLQLGDGASHDEAHALGAALGSALSQCQHPKHLCVSVATGTSTAAAGSVLDGMRASGAHRHVAALHLVNLGRVLPALSGLAHWPHLHTLEVGSELALQPGLGSSIAQLTGLQSLSLKLNAGSGGGFSTASLHGPHLQQLTQLTSLSLSIRSDSIRTPSAVELVRSLRGLQQLRKLDMNHFSPLNEVISALAAALTSLTALTCLDICRDPTNYIAPEAVAALVDGIAALPTLQHVGLPDRVDIKACAQPFSSLTALTSLRLNSLYTDQEPDAAQLLSRLARLRLSSWLSRHGDLPAGRASWLSQLREVTVEGKHIGMYLRLLADLPPDVCIKAAPQESLLIKCEAGTTQQEVRDAVARLLNSPTVKDGKSQLSFFHLGPEHCAAIKPLAEAVTSVVGLTPDMLPHMAGWRLKCLRLIVTTWNLPQLVQAALAVEGLCVESLEIYWGRLADGHTVNQAAVAAAQQLCQGLQGLRRVVTCGPHILTGCEREQQRMVQGLQQAVQGRGVEVRLVESL